MVDDEDFEYLNQWKWCRTTFGHIVRFENKKAILMHREILKTPLKKVSDHINGIPNDNRRENLRICSQSENMMNMGIRKGKKICKGVYLHPNGRFKATITINGRSKHIGYFGSEEEAARAYDEKARFYFGEFSRLNSI